MTDQDRDPLDALTRLLASDLSGATLQELADLLRQAQRIEVTALGRAVVAMREPTIPGDEKSRPSWRSLELLTGRPQSTLRFWHDRYLESIGQQPE